MTYLDRIQLGAFTITDTIDLKDLNDKTALLDPKAYYRLPMIKKESLDAAISYGQRIQLDTVHDECIVLGVNHFAVYRREKDKQFKSVRGLW